MNENRGKVDIRFLLTVVLLACNMRCSYTGVGTIVHLIQADLGLNSTMAGLITSIPIIVFAVMCPLSVPLGRRFGIGKMIAAALGLILIGVPLRACFGAAGLYCGTGLMSIGVGVMNALMVALIKLRSVEHTGIVTGVYSTTMALTTAIAIAINLSVCKVLGWRFDLAMWTVLTVAAIAVWYPQAGKEINRGAVRGGDAKLMGQALRSPRAWALLVYMGTQSLLFYSLSAWVPTILRFRGLSAETAATAATVLQLASLPTTLLIPIWLERMNWKRLLLAMDACYLAGGILFFFLRADSMLLWVAIVLLAIGMGTGFSACLFLFGKKSRNVAETSAISGFAQSGGYVLAAIGPVLMGRLNDLTGNWNAAMIFAFVIMILMTVGSLFSANREFIFPEE